MALGMFPDRRIAVRAIVSQGDYVVVRTKVTGTDPGGALFAPRLPGREERTFAFDWWSIYRIGHGKIAEQWGLPDIKLAIWQMRLNFLRGLTISLDPGSTDFPIVGSDLLLPHSPEPSSST